MPKRQANHCIDVMCLTKKNKNVANVSTANTSSSFSAEWATSLLWRYHMILYILPPLFSRFSDPQLLSLYKWLIRFCKTRAPFKSQSAHSFAEEYDLLIDALLLIMAGDINISCTSVSHLFQPMRLSAEERDGKRCEANGTLRTTRGCQLSFPSRIWAERAILRLTWFTVSLYPSSAPSDFAYAADSTQLWVELSDSQRSHVLWAKSNSSSLICLK